jgi:hypothetical protein
MAEEGARSAQKKEKTSRLKAGRKLAPAAFVLFVPFVLKIAGLSQDHRLGVSVSWWCKPERAARWIAAGRRRIHPTGATWRLSATE